MVAGLIITCAISTYHHKRCEFKSHSSKVSLIQHYAIKFVSDLGQAGGFLLGTPSGLLHQWNWLPRYNWNFCWNWH